MCQNEEAVRAGIVQLKPEYFDAVSGNRKLFSIIKVLFQKYQRVDLHIFQSQCEGLGFNESQALHIYHYCLDYDDSWEDAFEELKRLAAYKMVNAFSGKLSELNTNAAPLQTIANEATKFATSLLVSSRKSYYSGKEIDELKEEFGEPVITGHKYYDEVLYKNGGNRKGHMKGVICREKHGKTRSECWEVANNIRMGHKVLYLTLEGRKQDITGNIKQVLQDDWSEYRENLFVVDGVIELEELQAIIVEAVMVEGVDKVVIDYIQLVMPTERYSGENERINIATERIRHLMVKYDFHCSMLSQARKESQYSTPPKDADGNQLMPNGWKHVPKISDAYGSAALIKAAQIILVGYRPGMYEECIKVSELGKKVINPVGDWDPFHSFYIRPEVSRNKLDALHQWVQFVDTDTGLNLRGKVCVNV